MSICSLPLSLSFYLSLPLSISPSPSLPLSPSLPTPALTCSFQWIIKYLPLCSSICSHAQCPTQCAYFYYAGSELFTERFGSLLDQQDMQSSIALQVCCIDISTIAHQCLDNSSIPSNDCTVQWCVGPVIPYIQIDIRLHVCMQIPKILTYVEAKYIKSMLSFQDIRLFCMCYIYTSTVYCFVYSIHTCNACMHL